MDELTAVCLRLAGDPGRAADCARLARESSGRTAQLRAALEACRSQVANGNDHRMATPGADQGLRATVAAELAAAAAALPRRQREALALRDVAGLSHALIGEVLGLETAVVTELLVRGRLGLRAALRRTELGADLCPERQRTLRTVTLRLDAEPVSSADEDWLVEHLGHCQGCRAAHATLLEAAACYRGWPGPDAGESAAGAPS